uniref:Uncharacterized protein n=1 Tax=Anguilla anguilla TaxID=7936 RepID=A0A0E9QVS0_ANGAN
MLLATERLAPGDLFFFVCLTVS